MAKQIYDSMAMKRALTRMTYEIIEKNKGIDDLVLILKYFSGNLSNISAAFSLDISFKIT